MTLGIFEYREFLEIAVLVYEALLIIYELDKHTHKCINIASYAIITICAVDILYFMISKKPMSSTVIGQATYVGFIVVFVLLLIIYAVIVYRNNKKTTEEQAIVAETQDVEEEHAEEKTEQDN